MNDQLVDMLNSEKFREIFSEFFKISSDMSSGLENNLSVKEDLVKIGRDFVTYIGNFNMVVKEAIYGASDHEKETFWPEFIRRVHIISPKQLSLLLYLLVKERRRIEVGHLELFTCVDTMFLLYSIPGSSAYDLYNETFLAETLSALEILCRETIKILDDEILYSRIFLDLKLFLQAVDILMLSENTEFLLSTIVNIASTRIPEVLSLIVEVFGRISTELPSDRSKELVSNLIFALLPLFTEQSGDADKKKNEARSNAISTVERIIEMDNSVLVDLYIFIQHVSFRFTYQRGHKKYEKYLATTPSLNLIRMILMKLPADLQEKFFSFLFKQSKNAKFQVRVAAIIVITSIVASIPEEMEGSTITAENENKLITFIIGRINDKSLKVRYNALISILFDLENTKIIQRTFAEDEIKALEVLLLSRCYDKNVAVRGTALKGICTLYDLTGTPRRCIPILRERSVDISMKVRKFAIDALFGLCYDAVARGEQNLDDFVESWIESILPRVDDGEKRIAEHVALHLYDMLMNIAVGKGTDFSEFIRRLRPNDMPYISRAFDLLHDTSSGKISIESARSLEKAGTHLSLKVLSAFPSRVKVYLNIMELARALTVELAVGAIDDLHANVLLDILGDVIRVNDKTWDRKLLKIMIAAVLNLSAADYVLQKCTGLIIRLGDDNEKRTLLVGLTKKLESWISGELDQNTLYKLLFVVGELFFILKDSNVPHSILGPIQKLSFENDDAVVSAHAILALSKLSFADSKIARSNIPLLVKELIGSGRSSIRINSLVGISILYTRYGAWIDVYLNKITCTLADKDAVVRKQALGLLSNLLKEDYLKPDQNMIYRMLCLLIDKEKEVSEFAAQCIFSLLSSKKSLILEFFVFIFYEATGYSYSVPLDRETRRKKLIGEIDTPKEQNSLQNVDIDILDLTGPENRDRREKFFGIIAESTSLEVKMTLWKLIIEDILSPFVDNKQRNEHSLLIVEESLSLLDSDYMRDVLEFNAPDEDLHEDIASTTNEKKRRAVVGVMRKNVVENVIPTLLQLKHELLKMKAKQLGLVTDFLNYLYKVCSSEVKKLFAVNPSLEKEAEFDEQYAQSKMETQLRRQAELSPRVLRDIRVPPVPKLKKKIQRKRSNVVRKRIEDDDVSPMEVPLLEETTLEERKRHEKKKVVITSMPSPLPIRVVKRRSIAEVGEDVVLVQTPAEEEPQLKQWKLEEGTSEKEPGVADEKLLLRRTHKGTKRHR